MFYQIASLEILIYFCRLRQRIVQCPRLYTGEARNISSSELATALRPFYFAVHPDLFGRFPEQRVSVYIMV